MYMYRDALSVITSSLAAVRPDEAVRQALRDLPRPSGRLVLVAAGKAVWQMAKAACDAPGFDFDAGIVITKYGHGRGPLGKIDIREAGHPVPDESGFAATAAALKLVEGLTKDDAVLFLLSGGGSALFELPLIPAEELFDVTRQLLASGADIVETNTVRKRLSAVKGGRFAQLCAPAKVFTVALSDVLGDPPDMIASGPACPDASTCTQANAVVKKYGLRLTETAYDLLQKETPKALDNAEMRITGSVRQLCAAAAAKCAELGYEPLVLTDRLSCEAREAGAFMASVARTHSGDGVRRAFIAGGETVVRLRGHGRGGRNQELALAAAAGLRGLDGVLLFSLGSDGTDGPTDAAGGYVTGRSFDKLLSKGLDPAALLDDNDSYAALEACGAPIDLSADEMPAAATGGLIFTGPTGTNVNDVSVLLLG